MRPATHRVSTCAALIVSALVLLTPRTQGLGGGTWQTRAPMPTARVGSPHAVLDGKLYVASGCCVDPLSVAPLRFTQLEIYDPQTDAWTTGAPIPIGVYAATAGTINGKIYVAGGQRQSGNIANLQMYDPATNAWSEGPALPEAAAATAGGVIADKLYVATGMNPDNTTPVTSLRIFDPGTGQWSTGASIGTARAHAAAAVLGGKLYVVGGLTTGPVNTVEVYDPATNGWQTLAPMPTARYGAGLAVLNGILYAAGGSNNVQELDIVEAYDPSTNSWVQLEPMPAAHYLPAAVMVIDGALHVIGGADADNVQTATHHRYNLPAPTIQLSGTGTFVYSGSPRTVFASVSGINGAFVNGTTTIAYSPGGVNAPVGVGSYDVTVTFTSSDPGYDDASLTVPAGIVITPSNAFINGPNGVTAEATGFGGGIATFTVSAFDSDGPLIPGCAPSSGSIFPLGTTEVTCTAQGPNSSLATLTFPVNITDTRQPIIGPVANVFATATSAAGANVTYQLPFIADAADPNPAVTTSHASGSLFPHGMTSVLITVRDASGNTATRNLNVTVNAGLQSIAVTPGSTTVAPGQGRQFTATGAFTDGTSKILQGPSSGPPFSGPGNHRWQVRFLPGLGVDPCGTVNGGLSSQGFTPDASGAVDQLWGQTNNLLVRATGTATDTSVALTIACTNPAVPASVSLNATWTGTRFEGAMTDFGGSPVQVSITGWSPKAPLPAPRFGSGAATLAVNGADVVYVVGGTIGGAATDALNAYHPATDTWTPEAVLPTPRDGAGVAALNGQLFVVGGTAGGAASGAVESFDPQTGVWTTGWPALPTPRSNFSLVAANGRLYAIGGTGAGGVVDTVERFDPATGWTTLAPLPLAREGTAAGALNGGTLIVVAGGAPAGGAAVNRVDLYDVASNTWTQGPNLLAPTAGASGVVAMNALFVFGGSNNGALKLAEMYRPVAGLQPDGWAALSPMTTARTRAAASLVGDVIYVAGGQTGFPVAQDPSGVLEAFSVQSPQLFSLSQGNSGSSAQPVVAWRVSPAAGVATISPFGFANATAAGQATIIAEAAGISCETTNTCGAMTVEAPDTTPPAITSVTASPWLLLLPFGQMVPVTVSVTATDLVDPAPTCGIVAVFSSEPVGTTSPDWEFTPGSLTVRLRAERNATGPGRLYLIVVGCADRSGNASYGATLAFVPRLF
ncbi:MAG TPA: kelch repeat-containing protein [Vicinamibacterales bacterium]|nr:kelch repeat-containing protein [Vicinamibacterales bacterium]